MGPSTDGVPRPKCRPATLSVAGLLLAALLSAQLSDLQAGEPPENSIPIIAMKAGQGATSEDISITFLCELLWNYFDGFQIEGWTYSWDPVYDALELGDSTGVLAVLGPSFLCDLESVPARRWGRYDGEATLLDEDSAFVRPNTELTALTDAQDAPDMIDTLHWRCVGLAESVEDLDCIWYYDIFNEGPSWQLDRMLDTDYAVDDFFPSMFTQDTSLSIMDTDGVFSWVKWKSDSIHDANNAYTPPVSVCFGGLHTIEDDTWADYPGITLGVFHTQASSVRAYFNTRYQEYDDPLPDTTYANYPASLDFNAYPIRLVGHDWQVSEDSTATLGGELDQWMLDHFESIMDSTFIPAADDSDGPFPVHYHPQAFGRTGGEAIWEIETVPTPDTTIAYTSYSYRIPSPAELRMLCNLGLIRQAKGVFPYSIRSYSEWDGSTLDYHDSGLLDEDLIAFDAPYEEWVYRERPSGDFYYAPPDSIPPWTDVEGNDFDPLYELPARQNWSGEQATQDYLAWKFQAYARLWNSLRDTFGEIARVAPELSGLWWYDGYEDRAEIALADSAAPTEYIAPQI
jgi:hypothetical protein